MNGHSLKIWNRCSICRPEQPLQPFGLRDGMRTKQGLSRVCFRRAQEQFCEADGFQVRQRTFAVEVDGLSLTVAHGCRTKLPRAEENREGLSQSQAKKHAGYRKPVGLRVTDKDV